jgi:hypothetical protein
MKHTIFYSWQSDLPNATNRAFIEEALEKATVSLKADESLAIEAVIDRDVQGMTGAPDIATAIFSKINDAAVFVADVSIINAGTEGRVTPNPNVLIELGYAMKVLGPDRVILVMNTFFGGPELLPFDLKMRLVLTYRMPVDSQRATEKKVLASKLEGQLRALLPTLATSAPAEEPAENRLKKLLIDPKGYIVLQDLIDEQATQLADAVSAEHFQVSSPVPGPETIPSRISAYEAAFAEIAPTMLMLARFGTKDQLRLLETIFNTVAGVNRDPRGLTYNTWVYLSWYPVVYLSYLVGVAALSGGRYDVVGRLSRLKVRDPQQPNAQRPLLRSALGQFFNAGDAFKALPGLSNKKVPISEHLFVVLEQPLKAVIKSSTTYDQLFDRWEVLQFLLSASTEDQWGGAWGPVGRFGWRHHTFRSPFTEIVGEASDAKEEWPPFLAGLFNGSLDDFNKTVTDVQPLINRSAFW